MYAPVKYVFFFPPHLHLRWGALLEGFRLHIDITYQVRVYPFVQTQILL